MIDSVIESGSGRFPDIEKFHRDAIAATGLDDFGDQTYRDALSILLRNYESDPYMTKLGRERCTELIVGGLIGRLRSEDQWKKHPEVLHHEIKSPIIVTGLPRTGTTTLHKLLGIDPQFQQLEFWLGNAPMPRPPRVEWESLPEYRASADYCEKFFESVPEMRLIHNMTPEMPEEERTLLIQEFAHLFYMDGAYMPEYDRWVEAQSQRVAFQRMADNLRLIGSNDREKRWLLKDPMYLAHMDTILEIFPDAHIVQTHRHPLKSIPSICSLIWNFRKYYENPENDPKLIGPRKAEYWSNAMNKTLDLRNNHPNSFLDIDFRDIVRDPLHAIRKVYEFCGLTLNRKIEIEMDVWIKANAMGKHGEHRYDAEQFGLTTASLNKLFDRYIKNYQITLE